MKIKRWCSRICFLRDKYAIKIPHRVIWRMHNQDEVTWRSKKYNPHLYCSLLWWLIVVRERCLEAPFSWNDERECWKKLYKRRWWEMKWWRPEKKRSSFWLAKVGRRCWELVAVDFAPLYVCSKCRKNNW